MIVENFEKYPKDFLPSVSSWNALKITLQQRHNTKYCQERINRVCLLSQFNDKRTRLKYVKVTVGEKSRLVFQLWNASNSVKVVLPLNTGIETLETVTIDWITQRTHNNMEDEAFPPYVKSPLQAGIFAR